MKYCQLPAKSIVSAVMLVILSLMLGGCMSSLPQRSSGEQIQLEKRLARAQVENERSAIDDRRLQLIGEVISMIGIPYRYGGTSPKKGFDCSGLVQYSHNNVGVKVPRTAAQQHSKAKSKPVDNLLPGDLVFFRIDRRTNHVGIYLGGGEFIHAPRPGSNVRLESMRKRYWQKRFRGVGSYL